MFVNVDIFTISHVTNINLAFTYILTYVSTKARRRSNTDADDLWATHVFCEILVHK